MAAGPVSAFAPVPFGREECRIKPIHSEESDAEMNRIRYGALFEEIERTGREKEKEKENTSNENSPKSNSESKKKRNARKRNRSDMSPEELRRLRERERKAQQSRRDRIRAQKRQSQGWQDDDAAWEAFLDETEEKQIKKQSKHSSMPSMVCQENPSKEEHLVENKDAQTTNEKKTEKIKFDNQESFDDNESLLDNSHDNQTNIYSSDDSNHELKDSKKLSRRYFMPSDELERLRKRERDAKRKQREKYRQAGNDHHNTNQETSNPDIVADNGRESEQNEKRLRPNEHSSSDQSSIRDDQDRRSHEIRSSSKHVQDSHNDHLSPVHHFPPSPPGHHRQGFCHRSSPHSRHMDFLSLSYMDQHRHPYHHRRRYHHEPYISPTEKRFIHETKPNVPHSRHENLHSHHREPCRNNHSTHFIHQTPQHVRQYHPDSKPPPNQDLQKNKPDTSPDEKKKMISRNVDRKKLSEEELEELRKRERDYQRERRARIRKEKERTQAQQECYYKSNGNLSPLPESYYHSQHMFPVQHRIHRQHHYRDSIPYHERSFSYEDHYAFRETSPSAIKTEVKLTGASEAGSREHDEELKVAIPADERSNEQEQYHDMKHSESDLLQVVPKTREYEDKIPKSSASPSKSPANATTTSSPESMGQVKAKKSILESICSSLKKDSSKWTASGHDDEDNQDEEDYDDEEEEEDKLIVDLKEENKDMSEDMMDDSMDNEENLFKLKGELLSSDKDNEKPTDDNDMRMAREKITEEQLERRRRSNREAQRRRRARLKMQGTDDRLDQSSRDITGDAREIEHTRHHHNEREEKQETRKVYHVKESSSRPDSLYMHDLHPHYYHRERHHDMFQDKYGHYLPNPYKHFYYPMVRSPSFHMMQERDHEFSRHLHNEQDYSRDKYLHKRPLLSRHNHPLPPHYHHRRRHSPVLPVQENTNKQTSKDDSLDQSPSSSPKNDCKVEHTENSSIVQHQTDNSSPGEVTLKSGRKRKQCAPRRITSSVNTTPDQEVDVNGVENGEQNNVVILAGTDPFSEPEEMES